MNSEELEVSLKTEFENYLNGLAGEMRRNISDFQAKIEAEFEKHRAQLDEAFRELSGRFENDPEIDRPFREMIADHLRLARDDGAKVAATAFGEAEKLAAEMAPATTARYDLVRNAVSEIGSERTQAAILQSLINHAGHFAPRGAFFIVRGENLMGWNAFSEGKSHLAEAAREICIPVTADTILGKAVFGLRTIAREEAAGSDDNLFLDPLGFGERLGGVAVPLVVRGRAVAVLYADSASGESLNVDALETLVKVAGLTVDLRAESHPARPVSETVAESDEINAAEESGFSAPIAESVASENQYSSFETGSYAIPSSETEFAVEEYSGAVAVEEDEAEPEQAEAAEYADSFESVPPADEIAETTYFEAAEPEIEAIEYEMETPDTVSEVIMEQTEAEYSISTDDSFDASAGDTEPQATAVVDNAETTPETPAETSNGDHGGPALIEVSSRQPVRSRLSERNLDLPIEVAEEERRLHNDARRFARLLVSEIKLYNEQKVQEGRDARDLYDRLREAIDRSREMYDKRVQPTVSSKFDYFHYELVNGLAEGETAKLGAGYPGATV